LSRARIDTATVPGAIIPLLGDGAMSGDTLPIDLGPNTAGSPMVVTVTGGPRQVANMSVPTFPAGTPQEGAGGWWGTWHDTLQDYRQFAPVHRGVANILFADGGVRAFTDTNNDGYLNNGFPVIADNGFTSAEIEISPEVMASRRSLQEPR
jgi:prepilin-type processing-associated H-X9-DG protein